MIGYGIASVEFEEPLAASLPTSLPLIAAACWAGFRLVKAPQPAVENLLLGKKRLPQFRDAKRAELHRLVRYHFYGRKLDWQGKPCTVRQWLVLYQDDAALQQVVKSTVAYGKWLTGLQQKFARIALVALATEDSRSCYGQIGGDAATLRAMHEFMEEGGI